MERIKTGIYGLDEMLMGGLPKNRHVAIYGGPGTGKSSFGFEFLYRGAKNNESGLYISLEETPEELLDNFTSMFSGFRDLEKLVDENLIYIVKPDKISLEEISEIIEEKITEENSKRIVLDSITAVKYSFHDILEYRQTLFEFFSLIRTLECTMLFCLEAEYASRDNLKFDIEHYVADGIINLYNYDQGKNRVRALEIFKMRGTDHSRDLVPFKVFPDGIKVYHTEKVF